jgi:DNA-binding transcriptional regulator PaaX
MALNSKRKYEKKIEARLTEHEDFLFEHLRKEWEEMQRAAEKSKRREKLLDMTKKSGAALGITLLTLIALGGVLTLAVVAPNIFTAVGRIDKYRGFFDKKRLRKSVYYLKERKYVTVREGKRGSTELLLTNLGKQKVLQRAFGDLKINPPNGKWDGIWRLAIFDIPNSHKWEREGFRGRLRGMGFFPLQESVFAYPYPCREEIKFLTSLYNITHCVRYLEVQEIYADYDLREHFGIKE